MCVKFFEEDNYELRVLHANLFILHHMTCHDYPVEREHHYHLEDDDVKWRRRGRCVFMKDTISIFAYCALIYLHSVV